MESIRSFLNSLSFIQMKEAVGFVAKEVHVPPVPWPRTKADLEIQLSTITMFSTRIKMPLFIDINLGHS